MKKRPWLLKPRRAKDSQPMDKEPIPRAEACENCNEWSVRCRECGAWYDECHCPPDEQDWVNVPLQDVMTDPGTRWDPPDGISICERCVEAQPPDDYDGNAY